jgi:hypothetical protein
VDYAGDSRRFSDASALSNEFRLAKDISRLALEAGPAAPYLMTYGEPPLGSPYVGHFGINVWKSPDPHATPQPDSSIYPILKRRNSDQSIRSTFTTQQSKSTFNPYFHGADNPSDDCHRLSRQPADSNEGLHGDSLNEDEFKSCEFVYPTPSPPCANAANLSTSTSSNAHSAMDLDDQDGAFELPKHSHPFWTNPRIFDDHTLHKQGHIVWELAKKDSTARKLISASPIALIEELSTTLDYGFLTEFFLIYRCFLTPVQLARLLILRFRYVDCT